jgi:hypothetical protein
VIASAPTFGSAIHHHPRFELRVVLGRAVVSEPSIRATFT